MAKGQTPEEIIKQENDYCGLTAWHTAGITGEGVTVWNMEAAGRDHGLTTERRIKDAAPGANVITTMVSMIYTPDEIKEESVTYNGVKYSVDDFIKKFKIKVINVSRSGSKTAGNALSTFWGNLKAKYNLIFCNAVGNEGTGDWGGAIPYDVAMYIGAANLIKGKLQRASYSSVTKELDFMALTGTWSGTSFASPYVAGMAALLAQVKPSISQEEVYGYFIKHAEDMYEPGVDAYTGYGLAKMGSIDEDWEGNEVITKTKIKVNGQIKEVNRILKNGENYIRLRDFEDVLGVVNVEYDPVEKIPVVED